VLRLIGDVVDYLRAAGTLDPREDPADAVFLHTRVLLSHLTKYLSNLGSDDVAEFRGWLGSGGPTKYLRRFELAVAEQVTDFDPDGLSDWVADQEKQFNNESLAMVHELEAHISQDIRRRLEDKFAATWFRDGVPKAVYQEASTLAAEKQYEAGPGVTIDWWDCLHLIAYQKIMLHGGMALWNELYDEDYTLPSDRKAPWRNKSAWMSRLNEIRNKVFHNNSVSEEEYEFLQVLHSHFDLGGTGRND